MIPKKSINTISDIKGSYTAVSFQYNDTVATRFSTKWTVPSEPKQSSLNVLFLWNGLMPLQVPGVIQPLLCWEYFDNTPAWSVRHTYYNDYGFYISTDQIAVQPGEELEGVVELLSTETTGDGKMYEYQLSFTGDKFKSITTSFKTKRLHNCPIVCFEPYTDNYLNFPDDTLVKMRSMDAKLIKNGQEITSPLVWTFYNNSVQTPSDINGILVSDDIHNGEIDFYFR